MKGSFRLAILGSGRWGINHIRTASRLFGEDLKIVADPAPEARAKVKEISASIAFTDDATSVVKNKEIDAVIVATPAETHYPLTRDLLGQGKHVLVEKPIALRSAEAWELKDLAEQRGCVLMVGHVLLYHPAVRRMKELIDAGKIGHLQYVYSNRLNLGTIRNEENILWSFAPHDISVIQYLVGAPPTDVVARGASFVQHTIEDTTLTYLSYPGNIHAHIHVSWLHPFKEQRMVVVGSEGMIVFEDSAQTEKLRLFPKGFRNVAGSLEKFEGTYEAVPFESREPLAEEQLHFRECVREGRKPQTDAAHALSVLDILERAERSLTHGRTRTMQTNVYINEHAVVDDNVTIGEGTKIWHFTHVQKGASIGKKCSIGQNVNIANNVVIGDHVKIQNNVSVYEGVTLEDYVFCGPSMVFTNVKDPRSKYPQVGTEHYVKTLVREGASLGANATILCGITIGRHAFIGAGAMVTKNVPDFGLMVGNPAKLVGWVSEAGKKLEFGPDGIAVCPHTQKRYALDKGVVKELTA